MSTYLDPYLTNGTAVIIKKRPQYFKFIDYDFINNGEKEISLLNRDEELRFLILRRGML
jgi:hypothetical protein